MFPVCHDYLDFTTITVLGDLYKSQSYTQAPSFYLYSVREKYTEESSECVENLHIYIFLIFLYVTFLMYLI
jgi:hypothetical protein